MPQTHKDPLSEFEFYYSNSVNQPSAVRLGPWKMHIHISSQTGNNYGFNATRTNPLLFQVEQDLSERIDRAKEEPELIAKMTARLSQFESQVSQEGTFWD